MAAPSVPPATAHSLRDAGRQPATPFCVLLQDGTPLQIVRLLRVLPGKRIVGVGLYRGRSVLSKLLVARDSARHCDREQAGIHALAEAGIATPPLLHCGELQAGGHYLLTQYLDNATTLMDTPLAPETAAARLATAIRMLAHMHQKGLAQTDLHLGNFLLHDGTLYMLDGDGIAAQAVGKRLDAPTAMRNLALFLAQLPIHLAEPSNPWLDIYHSENPAIHPDRIGFARLARLARERRLDDLLSKCVRDCTQFKVEQRIDRFTVVAREEADWLGPMLADPDRFMRQGVSLKAGNSANVARVDMPGRSVVIKRYNIKGAAHAATRFWRPSRAWNAWREAHRLLALGIPTARPLAMIEQRLGPFRGQAWLITAYVGGPDLSRLWPRQPPGEPDETELGALRHLFRGLRLARISHGDLKATNLIWHNDQVVLIDLDSMRAHASAAGFARAHRKDTHRLLTNWPAASPTRQTLGTCLDMPDDKTR